MSNAVYVCRLIAEIKKRPALWDMQHVNYNARQYMARLWNEVAQNVGIHVVQCKHKWKNLRDTYLMEIKRSIRRIERDKLMGVYEPSTKYHSKWIYFPALSFLSDAKQDNSNAIENEITSSNPNEVHFGRVDNIKLVPDHNVYDDNNFISDDDLILEASQDVETIHASDQNRMSDNRPTSSCHSYKRSSRANDRVHILKRLCREERKLMKSSRQDVIGSNELGHIGDSDYNFLVSFLPQMKKLPELKNFEFRAKMSEAVLNILTPAITEEFPHRNITQQCSSHKNANGNQ